MSTRVGMYIFDVDLEHMDVERLSALKDACEYYINERHRDEIHRALTKLNLLAHTYGLDIAVKDADGKEIYLNELTLQIKDH